MPKSLAARIAQRQSQGTRYGRNKAAFFFVRDQVKRALDENCSVLSIWETLHAEGKVSMGYQAFRRAVKRHFAGQRSKSIWNQVSTRNEKKNGNENKNEIENENEERRGKPDPQGMHPVKGNETTTEAGFKFNPVSKKEDLF